jgi:hypothetical protein
MKDTLDSKTETSPTPKNEGLTSKGIAAMQGETKQEWKDHGMIDVPVADLPEPDGVTSPADFNHHITWQDAVNHTRQLPEIQAEIKAGKTRDDFYQEDVDQGVFGTQGKIGTYDLFYGKSEPIVLNKVDDQYDIVSGRHRIFAAKALGLETIPAQVHEKL